MSSARERATPEEQSAGAHHDSPTSRFTAVNGKEPAAGAATNGTAAGGARRRASDERSNGHGPPRISPPASQPPDWLPSPRADRPAYPPPSAYADPDAAPKRKRAGSGSGSPSPSPSRSMDRSSTAASSHHSHAVGAPAAPAPESETPRDPARRPPSPADAPYRHLRPPEDARDAAASPHHHWHARQYAAHAQMTSDEHIGAVLQRASRTMDAQQRGADPGAGDEDPAGLAYYDPDGREMSAQSDPKKRKRNFSNRTKTGCMTCRRRKKKCDENRPECNNCLRGGFVCSGYQQRGQWPKTEAKPPPVPLQSKTDYESAPYGPSPPYGGPMHGPPPARREPLPGYRGQSLRVDPQHGQARRPPDEEPPSAAVHGGPEDARLSAMAAYPHQMPTPITASSSAYPDRPPPHAYERGGPLHEPSRPEPRPDADAAPPQPAAAAAAAASLPPMLHPHLHAESAHSSAQVAAQLALSNLASTSRPRTQKEEMLAGRHYFPFDKELVLERERCHGACWRFNSSTNPNNGVSPEERSRLFRDILQPREHVLSPTQASPVTPVGRVGDHVVVEAPFNCDYGYNISIGQDVAIGKNCTILDTCEVTIGDRCSVGPNVNIYTATLPVDPKRRLGSRGPSLGRPITIHSDCWIGGGVTILPGRTIGKGSTVGAGSIVTRDVPPYTVVCGNPARVIRGLYPPHDG